MKRLIFFITIILFSTNLLIFSQSTKVQESQNCSNLATKLIKKEFGQRPDIYLSWNLPQSKNISSILIYRDTKQIFKKDLKNLSPIATLSNSETHYTDKVSDNQQYFYALITKTEDSSIYDVIIPSVNATVFGIQASIQTAQKYIPPEKNPPKAENQRELIPLPFINIDNFSDQKILLSQDSIEYSKRFRKFQKENKSQPLYVFPEDTSTTSTGEQYLLTQIINGSFINNDWDTAEQELKDFLKVNHQIQITRRANFYLGQVLYYQGYYREALNAFVLAEEVFPAKTRQWIQTVLEKIQLMQ